MQGGVKSHDGDCDGKLWMVRSRTLISARYQPLPIAITELGRFEAANVVPEDRFGDKELC